MDLRSAGDVADARLSKSGLGSDQACCVRQDNVPAWRGQLV